MASAVPEPVSPQACRSDAQHAVAFYETGDDLRARETVVVVATQRSSQMLRTWLGADAGSLRWTVPGLSYGHLGRAAEVFRGFLAAQRKAGVPTRLLAEYDAGDTMPDGTVPGGTGRMAGYLRAEAAANDLLGEYGFPWACLYDRRRFPAEVLAEAARVHPCLLSPGGRFTRNAAYVQPGEYLAGHPGPVSPPPSAVTLDVEFTDLNDLAAARRRVAETAGALGLGPADCRDVKVAAGEVIANVFRHGGLPCRIRVWRDAGAVVVRVDDPGPGGPLATAGFRPPDLARGSGAGLWLARHLADVLQVQAGGPGGTSVEMRFPLS
jgi:anti-sigma regulatory factor (Ser/Thr protein kinase)